jgi:cephalosporin hydroxylase
MSSDDRRTLLNVAAVATGPIIEIGSFFGGSAMMMSEFKRPIICVDKWEVACLDEVLKTHYWQKEFRNIKITDDNFYAIFRELEKAIPFIKSVRGDSVAPFTIERVKSLLGDELAGMIFIDGLHTFEQVSAEISAYLLLLKTNGFMVFHDYHPDFKGVVEAVNDAVNDGRLMVVKPGYTTVCRKL